VIKDTEITAGGTTNTIHTLTSTYEPEKFRFSAQLAKKIYDFTLRGGIIESRGGVGLDYDKGPLSLKFSAFDFSTKYGDKPHLKAWGSLNLTKNFYFVGGADDIINPHQPVDWFVGGGLRLVDEDVKNLIGIGARAVR
jgi:phospholipid/cholesterol/gamma-HCH transport system substrate-binding protein